MVTYKEYTDDKKGQARLKSEADRLSRDIAEGRIKSREELDLRITELKNLSSELFPEKSDLFDMVYASRFERLWKDLGN